MTLWRVDVAGVSHRFVEAETAAGARAHVIEAVLASLDVRASPAPKDIARMYEASGPVQRTNVIAALDGLTPPSGMREAKRARQRLARQIRYDRALREWVKDKTATAPRVADPELLSRLLMRTEGVHVRTVRERLHRGEVDSDT